MDTPYYDMLDTDSILSLETKIAESDRAKLLSILRQIGSLPIPYKTDETADVAFFQRECRHFVQEARNDTALYSYLLAESDVLKRALAICGKLTLMPRFCYDIATFAVLLAYEGASIWLEDYTSD